jgi:hypothetical protein
MKSLSLFRKDSQRGWFLDDGDLHPVDHRQAAALELGQQGLTLGIVRPRAWRRSSVRGRSGCAPAPCGELRPAFQHEGAGADRVLHDLVAIGLDHLARHGAVQVAARQHGLDQARARLDGLDLQRVAIQRLQALDLGS